MHETQIKPLSSLTPADLGEFPVWEFCNDDSGDETNVSPVVKLPVTHTSGRIVGLQVRLNAGGLAWAILGNADCSDPESTQHFLTLSIAKGSDWFSLARYHDVGHTVFGPAGLAKFLGLTIAEVFPISYDLRHVVAGESASLSGQICEQPLKRLTPDELMRLALR